MFIPVGEWLPSFLLTLAVEVPLVVLLLGRDRQDRVRIGALAVFANLATHPAVWFVFTQLFLVGTVEYTLAAETWAVVVEAVFYVVAIGGLSFRRAAVVSLIVNAASFAAGRALGSMGWLT
jgi:succinate-acetate transporter protein